MLKNLVCLVALCLSTTAFAKAKLYVGQTSPNTGAVYYHICQDKENGGPQLPCTACGVQPQSGSSTYQCKQAAPKPTVTPKATATLAPKTEGADEAFYTTVRIEAAPAGTEKDYPRVMFLMENGKCWKYRWVPDRANPSWQLSGLADYCGSCGRQYSDDVVVHGQCVQNTGEGFLPNGS